MKTVKLVSLLLIALLLSACGYSTLAEITDTSSAPLGEIPSVMIRVPDGELLHTSRYVTATVTLSAGIASDVDIIDTAAEIRIRGNSTSVGAKAPYNIKFSSKLDLFGFGRATKWYLVANMYDKSLMRNKLALDFAKTIGLAYTSNAEYVNVYLNGDYMGCYLLCEAIGMGKSQVDIDWNDGDALLELEPFVGYNNPCTFQTDKYGIILGFDDRDTVSDEETEAAKAVFDNFENALYSGDFSEIERAIDVGSFVDFYIVNELFKNVDFHVSSTRFYIKNGIIYAGPVWDFDISAGNASIPYYPEYYNMDLYGDSAEGIWCETLWYRTLFKYEEFKTLVKDRYLELQPTIVNLTTDNSLGMNRIDRLTTVYGEAFRQNFERWDVSSIDSTIEWQTQFKTFNESVAFLRDWLIRRNKYLLGALCGVTE